MQYLKVFRVGWRYLLRHPWQTILLVLGITLGVAVMVAIDLANASASRAFDLSTDAVSGRTTHSVIGNPEGMPEAIYISLLEAGLPFPMTPIIEEYVRSPQLGDRTLTLLGVDPFTEAPFRNYFGAQGEVPLNQLTAFLTIPGAVLLSQDLADQFEISSCPEQRDLPAGSLADCLINLTVNGSQVTAQLVGLLEPTDNLTAQALNSIILTDIATAQELTGRFGHLDRIDLILPAQVESSPSPEVTEAEQAITELLPQGIQLLPVTARAGTIQEMTAAFRVNLTALSLLALLVGLFLIYNTMTFSVIQRRPLFGTLRCLGTTRQEVFLMVIAEAIIIGSLGSILGIAFGILLGQGAVRLVTQTINDLFFVLSVEGVQVPLSSLIKGAVVGIAATLLTAAPPAWEAASVAPRTALYRSALEDKAQRAVWIVTLLGITLIFLGSVVLILIPTDDLIVSFLGTFAVIVGFAMLTPAITRLSARGVTPVFGRLWGALGRLAPRDITKSISRTSIAIAALMVAVSVTIGVSLMINSFRFTVETWLSQTLQGDIYISAPGPTATQPGSDLNPEVLTQVNQVEGIEAVASLRALTAISSLGPVNLTAIDQPVRSNELFIAGIGSSNQIWESMQSGAVIVSEPLANRLDVAVGEEIELFTDRGPVGFPIVGVFSDYASTQGTIRMDLQTYRQYWNDSPVTALAIFLEPETDLENTVQQLESLLNPIQPIFVRPNQELRQDALAVFDRTFAITGAMRLLATIVAFIGVLSTLLSLQLEKQRQFGVLRAVGLTVRQLWGLMLIETGFMGAVAGLLAMPAGYVLSLILIYIINRRSFGWTLQMQIEPAPFVLALVVAVSAAMLAAIYPARRIGQMATAEALRSE